MYLDIFFKVLGGLGLFLYGMGHLSNGMQKIAGERLKKILSLLTGNRFAAIGMGVFITALVQSSSVSTVMTIGFVNASLLTLQQALGVILGANIGTTVTGWLLALKIGVYGLPLAGLASLMYMFSSKEKNKNRALTLLGLGLLFLGLEFMSDGFKPFRTMPEFIKFFQSFNASPNGTLYYPGIIKATLVGACVTAIVQSSAATLGITITLAVQGLITYETAVALVLGENIGTTVTALLASLTATTNAKRAAYAHTLINIIGVCWVIPIFPFYLTFLSKISNVNHIPTAIATAHTTFNILNVCFFVPFVGYFSRFLTWAVPEDKNIVASNKVTHLDSLMTDLPSVVIGQTKEEILTMGNEIYQVFEKINAVYLDRDKANEAVDFVAIVEDRMDLFEKEITDANFAIMHKGLDESEISETRENLIVCEEYESISDYQLRISKTLKKIIDHDVYLDDMRKNTIVNLHNDIEAIFKDVNTAYRTNSKDAFILALKKCNNIKGTYHKARQLHLDNIPTELKDAMLSTGYMDILNYYRRIKEHLYAIIETYIKIQ
ncbi:MAG: Na/Pi cotransporter family protein [Fusobacteriaceae bacterium]